MDELVRGALRKVAMEIDEWGIFTVSLAERRSVTVRAVAPRPIGGRLSLVRPVVRRCTMSPRIAAASAALRDWARLRSSR
jgi:hypothetical protein